MTYPVQKSERQWRRQLTAEQFRVTRQGQTEAAFSGRYWDCDEPGTYLCVCCGEPLFRSEAKFPSTTGWPCFTQPVDPACIQEQQDTSHNMVRTEVLCSRCGAHLGHVFPDGPPPTGQRYCLNSAALELEPGS